MRDVMLVGRGLERLDRSRSHHILSQEEVIVILCANNINLGEVKLLFIEFQCQTGDGVHPNEHGQPHISDVSGGWREDNILARARDHRHDQEPLSGPVAAAAPHCSLPQ